MGVFVPARGSQTMVAPSTRPGCAWLPSPSASLAVRALRGMHPGEIPQGFVPPGRKGKGGGGLPLPTAKEAAEKHGWPQLERPRGLSHLGPQLGCRHPRGLLRGDPLLAAGLPWWGCLRGDHRLQRPHAWPLQAQPQFCSEPNAPGQVGEHRSRPGTQSRGRGDKVKEGWCFTPRLLLSGLLQCLFYRVKPRSMTGSGITRHGPFSLG